MPTTRPRHVITETDDVAAALDDAAKRWPEDGGDRRRLLLRLIAAGHDVALAQRETELTERRAAIERTGGVLTGVFGPGYLDRLHEDWPE